MNYLDEAITKSLDEFMEYYKIVDTKEIYSNGTEFVPIFRVKQWEEYNNKDKEIERLNNIINELEHDFKSYDLEYLRETYQCSLADFIETELKRIQELKMGVNR